jgi:hypothetical protein
MGLSCNRIQSSFRCLTFSVQFDAVPFRVFGIRCGVDQLIEGIAQCSLIPRVAERSIRVLGRDYAARALRKGYFKP